MVKTEVPDDQHRKDEAVTHPRSALRNEQRYACTLTGALVIVRRTGARKLRQTQRSCGPRCAVDANDQASKEAVTWKRIGVAMQSLSAVSDSTADEFFAKSADMIGGELLPMGRFRSGLTYTSSQPVGGQRFFGDRPLRRSL